MSANAYITGVDPIQETHLSEPGLLVLDVAAFDDDTVSLPERDRPHLGCHRRPHYP
ncbi:hypothetical protein GCM10010372_83460 [Streptomyces tauricus]|nr:hypothetical protein GCM10010372_83460 [Streptomyces tauricus]